MSEAGFIHTNLPLIIPAKSARVYLCLCVYAFGSLAYYKIYQQFALGLPEYIPSVVGLDVPRNYAHTGMMTGKGDDSPLRILNFI